MNCETETRCIRPCVAWLITCLLARVVGWLLVCLFAWLSRPFICLVARSFIHSFIHSFVHSFIHSFICSFVHSFIHSFICSFVRSLVKSFIRYHEAATTRTVVRPCVSCLLDHALAWLVTWLFKLWVITTMPSPMHIIHTTHVHYTSCHHS